MLQAMRKFLLLLCSLFVFSACDNNNSPDNKLYQVKKTGLDKGLIYALSTNDEADFVDILGQAYDGKSDEEIRKILSSKEEKSGKTVGHFIVRADKFDVEILREICARVPENCTAQDVNKQTSLDVLVQTPKNLNVDSVSVYLDNQVPLPTIMTALAGASESASRNDVLIHFMQDPSVLTDEVLTELTADNFARFSRDFLERLRRFANAAENIVALRVRDEFNNKFAHLQQREDVINLDHNYMTTVTGKDAQGHEVISDPYLLLGKNPDKIFKFSLRGVLIGKNPPYYIRSAFVEEARAGFVNYNAFVARLDLMAQEALLAKNAVIPEDHQAAVLKAAKDTFEAARKAQKKITADKAAADKAAADKAAADKAAADKAAADKAAADKAAADKAAADKAAAEKAAADQAAADKAAADKAAADKAAADKAAADKAAADKAAADKAAADKAAADKAAADKAAADKAAADKAAADKAAADKAAADKAAADQAAADKAAADQAAADQAAAAKASTEKVDQPAIL